MQNSINIFFISITNCSNNQKAQSQKSRDLQKQISGLQNPGIVITIRNVLEFLCVQTVWRSS